MYVKGFLLYSTEAQGKLVISHETLMAHYIFGFNAQGAVGVTSEGFGISSENDMPKVKLSTCLGDSEASGNNSNNNIDPCSL